MSYKVEFVLDLDDSYSGFFDRRNWKDYTFRFKEVFGGKLTNISKHIPVGEYGHIKWEWDFKDETEAKWWMTYGDYYVDVYWKKKRIATEIRLREPQMGHWYSDAPNYDLRGGYQDTNFKADKAKFDKLTSVKIVLKLAATEAPSEKPQDTTKEQKIGDSASGSLIERAKAAARFNSIPSNYWILGERAGTNRPNKFDDDIHLMQGEKLIQTVKGTTHPGVPYLTTKMNASGAPIWDFGWHYQVWKKGIHKHKIKAFTQVGAAYVRRDTNKDLMPGNSGKVHSESGMGLNFHPASYNPNGSSKEIGEWSAGCVVAQSATDYYQIYNKIINSGQVTLTFCVISGDI
jgi:hypothetical protein